MAFMVGAVALAMFGTGCGSGSATDSTTTIQGPPRQQVLDTVKRALTSQDAASVCEGLMTLRYVDQKFGSITNCEAQEQPAALTDISVRKLAGDQATVLAFNGESSNYTGSWELDTGLFISVKRNSAGWRLTGEALGSQRGG